MNGQTERDQGPFNSWNNEDTMESPCAIFATKDHIVVGPKNSFEELPLDGTTHSRVVEPGHFPGCEESEAVCHDLSSSHSLFLKTTKTLSLIHQDIVSLKQLKDFAKMVSLRRLNLHMNRIDALDNSSLKHLSFLEELDLSGNELKTISNDCFTGLGRLSRLNLSTNSLTQLASHSFAPLASLQWVSLSFNQLKEVRALRSLPHSAQLLYADLCGNQIVQLQEVEVALEGQTNLHVLRLRIPSWSSSYTVGSACAENGFVVSAKDDKGSTSSAIPWYTKRLVSRFPSLRELDGFTVGRDPLRGALLQQQLPPVSEQPTVPPLRALDYPGSWVTTSFSLQPETWSKVSSPSSSSTHLHRRSTVLPQKPRVRKLKDREGRMPPKPRSIQQERPSHFQSDIRLRSSSTSQGSANSESSSHEQRHQRRSTKEVNRKKKVSDTRRSPSPLKPSRTATSTAVSHDGAVRGSSASHNLPWKEKQVSSTTVPTTLEESKQIVTVTPPAAASLNKSGTEEREKLNLQAQQIRFLEQECRRLEDSIDARDEIWKLQLRHMAEEKERELTEAAVKWEKLLNDSGARERELKAQVDALRAELERQQQEMVLSRKQLSALHAEKVKQLELHFEREVAGVEKREIEKAEAARAELTVQCEREKQSLLETIRQWEQHASQLEEERKSASVLYAEQISSFQRYVMQRQELEGVERAEMEARREMLLDWVSGCTTLSRISPYVEGEGILCSVLAWCSQLFRVAAAEGAKHEASLQKSQEYQKWLQEELQAIHYEAQATKARHTEECKVLRSALKEMEERFCTVTRLLEDRAEAASQNPDDNVATSDCGPSSAVEPGEDQGGGETEKPILARMETACQIVVETHHALHKENERLLLQVQELEKQKARLIEEALEQRRTDQERFQQEMEQENERLAILTMEKEGLSREVRNLQADLQRKVESFETLEEEAIEKLEEKRQLLTQLKEEVDQLKLQADESKSRAIRYKTQLEEASQTLRQVEAIVGRSSAVWSQTADLDAVSWSMDSNALLSHIEELVKGGAGGRVEELEQQQQRLVDALRVARNQLIKATQRNSEQEAQIKLEYQRHSAAEKELTQMREKVMEMERKTNAKQAATLEALAQMFRADSN